MIGPIVGRTSLFRRGFLGIGSSGGRHGDGVMAGKVSCYVTQFNTKLTVPDLPKIFCWSQSLW